MSTRSVIGKVLEDGKVKTIYCHWDGYPSNNGKLLLESYQDPQKIDTLLSLGDLSSLASEIGEKHAFDDRQDNQCTFYNRDRGESDVDAIIVEFNSLAERANNCNAEFVYIFTDKGWEFTPVKYGSKALKFRKLTKAAVKKD